MSDSQHSSSDAERPNDASSHDESEEENLVESLVVGRTKRITAGNRLSSLVEKEQGDEIELLFAEDEEEDESFDEDEDDASDANLGDSSSDEEEAEGHHSADEMAGEQELQRQARQESKKRKAREKAKMPGMARKRVKIDPTAVRDVAVAAPRPKKKSERVSWVATVADAPTRISSRKQTIQNREVVHQRLVNSEKQRVKVMRQMEEAQKRKEASKPKVLTQAQRLEEAAKMERKNAKSLSRWEESEKKRAADEKAKLEALHNRQLSGPVISWWSGIVRWVDGKIGQLGVKEIRESGNKEEPVSVSENMNVADNSAPSQDNPSSQNADPQVIDASGPQSAPMVTQQQAYPTYPQHAYAQPIQFTTPQGPRGFLDGIHAYAALPVPQPQAEFTGTADGGSLPSTPFNQPPRDPYQAGRSVPSTDRPAEIGFSSRNLVALKNVDANAQRLPEFQNSVLIKKHRAKPQKAPSEHCAITGQPAQFRDPKTGLPYSHAHAYQEIQRLRDGGSRWSSLLECYVGPAATAARGVPEGFWKQG